MPKTWEPTQHSDPVGDESQLYDLSQSEEDSEDEEEEVRAKMEVLLDKGLVDWTRVMPITPVRQVIVNAYCAGVDCVDRERYARVRKVVFVDYEEVKTLRDFVLLKSMHEGVCKCVAEAGLTIELVQD